MTIGYLRVSTSKQLLKNQQDEISRYAQENNIIIDQWIMEVVSGKKSHNGRRLGRTISKMKKGDTLIVSEVSRLSRNLTDIMTIMGNCLKKGINIYTTKERYKFDDSLNSKILCFAFGLVAEIERNLISQRTKQSLARLRAENKQLGRPKGSTHNYSKLADKDNLIKKHLQENKSKYSLAKKLKVSYSTLYRYLKKYYTD